MKGIIGSVISMSLLLTSCLQGVDDHTYVTISDSDVEKFRQILYGGMGKTTEKWEKTNSDGSVTFGLKEGQDENTFVRLVQLYGFVPVGGRGHATPYSCSHDLCRCDGNKLRSFVRSQDVSGSFEAITLQFGSMTIDGSCHLGLYDIPSLEFYEKTKNAKN